MMKNNSSPSVLIVDDEAVMVMLLQVRLRASGYHVSATASSKEEAISKAVETKPDYVIMDIRLTGKGDGIEAAEQILKRLQTKIIFITGYSEGDIKRRALELDPAAFITKPFDIAELLTILEQV
ncbi:response regulator [Chitinispirillales bacterium ANBcel5]|uniref:response regulator n=1 Tax=Cellulosispirillum alkaliphilum TaxID=3039283 RepID=UPI002A528915|nr:response regulator [Chitinispirillales bacterium ANBcel5]